MFPNFQTVAEHVHRHADWRIIGDSVIRRAEHANARTAGAAETVLYRDQDSAFSVLLLMTATAKPPHEALVVLEMRNFAFPELCYPYHKVFLLHISSVRPYLENA